MRQRTFDARVKKVLREELEQPEVWHYFSFAGENFNGAVIVLAHGITDGLMKINLLGCNPHGEVMAAPIPDEGLPPEQYRNRLLTKSDILEFWPDAKTIREFDEEHR